MTKYQFKRNNNFHFCLVYLEPSDEVKEAETASVEETSVEGEIKINYGCIQCDLMLLLKVVHVLPKTKHSIKVAQI